MSIPHDAALDYAEIVDPDAGPVGPVHPGAILAEDFLAPLGLSAYALAKAISVPPDRIAEIIRGERAVTADTALGLARFLGTSPDFWLGLQVAHDLEITRTARCAARAGSDPARGLSGRRDPAPDVVSRFSAGSGATC